MRPEQLEGLHVGWPDPPSPATFLASLCRMNAVALAVDAATKAVVGFACGMTDRTLFLYIWDHEVLPDYAGRGIEREMIRRLLERHGRVYQVNTILMPGKRALFEGLGFAAYDTGTNGVALTKMRMEWQNGGPHAVK